MPRTGQIMLLTVGLLLAGTGWADDTQPLVRSVLLQPDSDVWTQTRPVFNFREKSALERLSKFRNLSFLTLATTPRTRLFLGVNQDGLVGLHFNALTHPGDDRVLELASLQSAD